MIRAAKKLGFRFERDDAENLVASLRLPRSIP